MSGGKNIYIAIRAIRSFFACVLFVTVSSFSKLISYFIACRMTADVDKNVILALHVLFAVLIYHSFLLAFILTDGTARKIYFDMNCAKKEYILSAWEVRVSLIFFAVSFFSVPKSYAVDSLLELLSLPKWCTALVLVVLFVTVHVLTWIEALYEWRKNEEKLRKEKRKPGDTSLLIKNIISICLAYPIMAYILPILIPPFRTLPSTLLVLCAVVIPIIIVLVVFISSFDYIRAFCIRRKFIKTLKKAAKQNGYVLSMLKHPYMSLFHDYDECSFTVKAHGKVYSCKFIAGISYGDPMYFEENGVGKVIRHVSFRYRTPIGGPFSRGGLIWHKLPEDLMQFHTEFKYSFDGEGTKVLLICPTPHTIYVSGHGQQKQIDVNDKIWGYTIMTATAFINALERDTVL